VERGIPTGFAMLKSVVTHRIERIPIGQLRGASCLKLFSRGIELQFCGDDLLHVVRFREGRNHFPFLSCSTVTLYKAIPVALIGSGKNTTCFRRSSCSSGLSAAIGPLM
jgi:hypothetical protein